MVDFSSLNPYENMEVLIGEDPVSLLALIKAQKAPIKICFIVPYGTKTAAYVMGDIRLPKKKTNKGDK